MSVSQQIHSHKVLFATARVWVTAVSRRSIQIRALLDPGSTCTFVSKSLAQALNAKPLKVSAALSGIGGTPSGVSSSVINAHISTSQVDEPICSTQALVLPSITSYLPDAKLPWDEWSHLDGLRWADDLTSEEPIHMLIGADIFGALVREGIRRGRPHEPVAINTIFG